jgi:hypothetical protein
VIRGEKDTLNELMKNILENKVFYNDAVLKS